MLKAIILIGGPSNGTRFRPLSLDTPKPLFPVAGFPMIYHHIEAAIKVDGMKEIILIGSYLKDQHLNDFMLKMQRVFKMSVRYFQEYAPLGTAGALYHFRDQIQSGSPELLLVMNADVCGDFPLTEMLKFHRNIQTKSPFHFTLLSTEATRQQSVNYGCIVEDRDTHMVLHYVEKPRTFVSTLISCGIFIFSLEIFDIIGEVFHRYQDKISYDFTEIDDHTDITAATQTPVIRLEQDIFAKELASAGNLFVYQTSKFWSQLKSAGAAIYANRHYLNIYKHSHPERLAKSRDQGPLIIGDVYIHPSATVHPTATLGPNVTIEKNVVISAGVRVREAMILEGAVIHEHCCVIHSIVGWGSDVGQWTRVEGTPYDPNPNKPFAKLDIQELFNPEGKLSPSITVIGSKVKIPDEVIVLNSIVLPDKALERSCKNQILL